MTFNTIRPFTSADEKRLNTSARRFVERHCLRLDSAWFLDDRPWVALGFELWSRDGNCSDTAHLRRLWVACRCRALKVPVAPDIVVAYGHVAKADDVCAYLQSLRAQAEDRANEDKRHD